MESKNLYYFMAATLLLNVTPGADMVYVITRSLSNGVKGGIVAALGIGLGCLFHVVLATSGLAAVLYKSAWLFNLIRYAGGAYLILLGGQLLFEKPETFYNQLHAAAGERSFTHVFKQGLLTNVLNPKVALFVLAFLPQFIDKQKDNVQLRLALLGLLFTASGILVNVLVALLVGHLGRRLVESPGLVRNQRRISGLALIALGIHVVLIHAP
jgi:threonine/homoserine/homoserine lactone efflux protein